MHAGGVDVFSATDGAGDKFVVWFTLVDETGADDRGARADGHD